MISEDLKSKSRIYCWDRFSPTDIDDEFIPNSVESSKTSHFYFDFKVNNQSTICKMWTSKVYPEFVRYSVNLMNKCIYENCDEAELHPGERLLMEKTVKMTP